MPRKSRLDVMSQTPLCNTDMLAQHSLVLVTPRSPSGRPALVFLATMRHRPHDVRLPIGGDSQDPSRRRACPDGHRDGRSTQMGGVETPTTVNWRPTGGDVGDRDNELKRSSVPSGVDTILGSLRSPWRNAFGSGQRGLGLSHRLPFAVSEAV